MHVSHTTAAMPKRQTALSRTTARSMLLWNAIINMPSWECCSSGSSPKACASASYAIISFFCNNRCYASAPDPSVGEGLARETNHIRSKVCIRTLLFCKTWSKHTMYVYKATVWVWPWTGLSFWHALDCVCTLFLLWIWVRCIILALWCP